MPEPHGWYDFLPIIAVLVMLVVIVGALVETF
jgi:hypothetical protein